MYLPNIFYINPNFATQAIISTKFDQVEVVTVKILLEIPRTLNELLRNHVSARQIRSTELVNGKISTWIFGDVQILLAGLVHHFSVECAPLYTALPKVFVHL